MRFTILITLLAALFIIPEFALAAHRATGVGTVASNLLEPVGVLSDFVATASIIIGVCCLFGSLVRYMQYKVNHLASPLSGVIVLFILGLLLVLLPLAYKLEEEGIPYIAHHMSTK